MAHEFCFILCNYHMKIMKFSENIRCYVGKGSRIKNYIIQQLQVWKNYGNVHRKRETNWLRWQNDN